MTDEKEEDDDEDGSPEDMLEAFEQEIKTEGTRGGDDTFAVMPGKDTVIFIINSIPGREGKALAMQLPPELAMQLGNALAACAFAVSSLSASDVPLEKEEKKVTLH